MRPINNLTSRMTSAWVWGGIWANDGESSSDSTVTDVDDDRVSDEALTATSVKVTAGIADVCPLGVALAAPSTAPYDRWRFVGRVRIEDVHHHLFVDLGVHGIGVFFLMRSDHLSKYPPRSC